MASIRCLMAAIGVVVLALSPAARAATPYAIDVILPLTGGGAFLGQGERANLAALEATVNQDGGINGQPLHFVFHDDESHPQTAVQVAAQVIAGHPAVVLGSALVGSCAAMAPLMRDGPVMYCLSPGLKPAPGIPAFATSAAPLDQFAALVRFSRLNGWRRIAVLNATDATGQDADNSIRATVALPENHDMVLAAHEHFALTDLSATAEIERIKASGAQFLIAWVTGAPIATVFKGIIQAGLDLPVAVSAGNQAFAQLAQYADFLPRQLLIPSPLFPAHDGVLTLDPRVEAAQHRMYAALAAHGVKPDNMTANSWDAGLIVVAALRKLGAGAGWRQIYDEISTLQGFAGIDGMYDFVAYPGRGLGPDNSVVVRYDAAGQRWVWLSRPGGTPLEMPAAGQ